MLPEFLTGFNGAVFTLSATFTSTSYLYSNSENVGHCAQSALYAAVQLGGGVTSVEIKLQQGMSGSIGPWYDYPLVDTANKVTVSNEYVSVVKPYVLRLDANTPSLTQGVGPIAFPLLMPYFRVAYKLTGAGTAAITVIVSRNLT